MAGPKDVLQGVNTGHQQPSSVIHVAQAGMCGSAKSASKTPGSASGLLLEQFTLDSSGSPPVQGGRGTGAGPGGQQNCSLSPPVHPEIAHWTQESSIDSSSLWTATHGRRTGVEHNSVFNGDKSIGYCWIISFLSWTY